MEESFRLITNVDFVDVEVNGRSMRLWCHALLVEYVHGFPGDEPQRRVRAFGTDAAWPVFTHWLKCDSVEYEMREAQGDSVFIVGDASPEPRPLISGVTLTFKDGSQFFVQIADRESPLDVEDFSRCTDVWRVLQVKVRSYWQAPNFPVLQYVPR